MKPLTSLFAALLLASCALQTSAATPKPAQKHSASRTKAQAAKPARVSKAANGAGPAYAQRREVMQEAEAMAARLGLEVSFVRQAVGQAHYMASVAKAVLPPPVGVPKNWTLYRSRFVEPRRIQAGVAFWLAQRETLQRAEALTGVPASIIAGIIGVETIYGRNMGSYRVVDALCTLAFDFPSAHPKAQARAAFFKSELEAYLALTARTHTDPMALRGSYAGAMGWPQFMPSSWNRYAVDFDGDGRIDLFNSPADVIGSVANYLKTFHWQRGMPTHYAVRFDPATLDLPTLLAPDLLPSFSVAELAARGALLDGPLAQTVQTTPPTGPLALIALENGDAPTHYVVGTENFYAITRYNWSSYYAMAVIELGEAVAAAAAGSDPKAPVPPVPPAPPAPTDAPTQ